MKFAQLGIVASIALGLNGVPLLFPFPGTRLLDTAVAQTQPDASGGVVLPPFPGTGGTPPLSSATDWTGSSFYCGLKFDDFPVRRHECTARIDRNQITVTLREIPPEVPESPAAAQRLSRRQRVEPITFQIPLSDVFAFNAQIQRSRVPGFFTEVDGQPLASLTVGFIMPASTERPNRTNRINLATNSINAALQAQSALIEAMAGNENRLARVNAAETAGISDVNQAAEKLRETGECVRCNLQGADLQGTDLKDANLEGANLSGANLSGAKLNRAYLVGTNLAGAKLTGSELNEAVLLRSSLVSADLSGADLDEANFSAADLSSANLTGARGNLVVLVTANLTNANLSNAELKGVNLAAANLRGAILQVEQFETYRLVTSTYTRTVEPTLCGATLPDGSRSNQGC